MNTSFKKLGILCILVVLFYSAGANNYYVDATKGNDRNKGTSMSLAWKSLEYVNSVEFQPGDSILFKRGNKWIGTFRPKGNGTKNKRIVIGAFGKGAAPVIDAEGKKGDADFMSASILLFNQEYWEIRDIDVSGFDSDYLCKNTRGIQYTSCM